MVDVGVGDEDLGEFEAEGCEAAVDAGDVFAGVDDDGFEGGGVTEDGAVALEGADGEGFEEEGGLDGVGHGLILSGGGLSEGEGAFAL